MPWLRAAGDLNYRSLSLNLFPWSPKARVFSNGTACKANFLEDISKRKRDDTIDKVKMQPHVQGMKLTGDLGPIPRCSWLDGYET